MFPARRCTALSYSRPCWMIVHSEFTSIMLDWLIPKSVNVVKEWTMHSIISSSVHDVVISASHWCKLLIRHGLKPTVNDHLVVLLHCCLHRPISMYSLRISARTLWTLFLLSLISLDVAFDILQIHENGQKTEKYYVESVWLFSDVLLFKWRFTYVCHHPWFVHCS